MYYLSDTNQIYPPTISGLNSANSSTISLPLLDIKVNLIINQIMKDYPIPRKTFHRRFKRVKHTVKLFFTKIHNYKNPSTRKLNSKYNDHSSPYKTNPKLHRLWKKRAAQHYEKHYDCSMSEIESSKRVRIQEFVPLPTRLFWRFMTGTGIIPKKSVVRQIGDRNRHLIGLSNRKRLKDGRTIIIRKNRRSG